MNRRAVVLAGVLATLLAVLAFLLLRDPTPMAGSSHGAGSSAAREPDAPTVPQPTDPAFRVLFIGNSFTFFHDLPAIVRGLGQTDRVAIATTMRAPGGAKLEQQNQAAEVHQLLAQRWDVVVLQEQSQTPTFEGDRRQRSIPAARALREEATRAGARALLFTTWGYRDGDRENLPTDTYEAMQARLDVGFDEISKRAKLDVAPINKAFALAHREHPDWPLWVSDGHHPDLETSYLAAVVLYESITKRDARQNAFVRGLDAERAKALREVAHRAAASSP